MNKRDIIVLGLIVLVLAGILLIIPFRASPPRSPNAITDVPESQFPDFFPTVPIEGYTEIVANYNAVAPDGRVQATRTVASRKSVAENFMFYKTFFNMNGSVWTVVGEVNDPQDADHRALFAKSAGGVLTINISKGTAAETSVVDISFVAAQRK